VDDGGKAYIDDKATDNLVFVRPHLLEITRSPNGGNYFRATTKHINAAGPLVKVEAMTEWGATVHVETSQERFRELAPAKDEAVFVTPKNVAVFQQERK
jgi:sulfate/thiosulfate transport system ATP-binding protein